MEWQQENVTESIPSCPEICDKWLCWPVTPAGQNATKPCPNIKGLLDNAMTYKYCTLSSTWEVKESLDGERINYTHYETCMMPQVRQLAKMCSSFEESECPKIGRVTRLIELVGLSLSLLTLVVSLCIFFYYRILKNNRTKIHKNLFFATLFQVLFRLIKYIDQELEDGRKFLVDGYYVFETCTVLMEYSKTAMFMWMFIEGLYLHNVTSVTVFQEYLYIKYYIWCGWLVPAVMTLIWLCVMVVKGVKSTWAYYYFLPYYWILEGPRSSLIIINLIFLLNIIRVLISKLRRTHSSELEQVSKAVRAAIFLLPLMGTAHILFLIDYQFGVAWKFALWSYISYFLNTFQGFFVAVLYCFWNGEVISAIRNSYLLNASLRRSNYASCRGISTISASRHGGRNNWMFRCVKCCLPQSRSAEEKENDLLDVNERRERTTIISVETLPMIPTNGNGNAIDVRHETKEEELSLR